MIGKVKAINSMIEAFKKEDIPVRTFTIDLDAPFPSLEKLLGDFVEKNNLLVPYRTVSTSIGLLAGWEDQDLAILSVSPDQMNRLMDRERLHITPNFGGPGGSSCDERKYHLAGIIQGKEIHLSAEMSFIKNYKLENTSGMCHVKHYAEVGKPHISIERKDNLPYWFLTDPKKVA